MNPPELSIIVPVYNEAATLQKIMQKIIQACSDAQIVYIDDGSKDDSLAILKANARPQDTVQTKPNGGKGSAIREGLKYTQGQYTVIQDADLEYDPREILSLLSEAQRHPRAAVFGSRFLKKNPNIYKLNHYGNKFLTLIVNILFGGKLTDSYTCYKLLPSNLFRSLDLTARGFELEAEICAKCLKRGIEIHEVSISYHPRTIEEGKKIRFSDAWKGLMMMLKIRFALHQKD